MMDLCRLKNAELAKHLQKYKVRVVLWERQRQRRRRIQSLGWQRQGSWTQSQSFLVWLEKQVTPVSAYTQDKKGDRSSRTVTIAKRRMSWNVDHDSSTTRNKKLECFWWSCGTSWKELIWSPISLLSLGTTVYVHKKTRIILVGLCGRFKKTWLEGSRTWAPCGKILQIEIDFEDPKPLIDQVYSGCTQREADVDPQAVQSKTELFTQLTRGGWRRKNERKILVGKDHCLELWCGRSCRNMRWEILRISKERCVFLFSVWQHHV